MTTLESFGLVVPKSDWERGVANFGKFFSKSALRRFGPGLGWLCHYDGSLIEWLWNGDGLCWSCQAHFVNGGNRRLAA